MPGIKFTPVNKIPAPKAATGARGVYLEAFKYLRANPGKAVKLEGRPHTGVAVRINSGQVKGCKPGEFFATCRNTKDGRGDIYVTYVGPQPNEDFHDKTVAL